LKKRIVKMVGLFALQILLVRRAQSYPTPVDFDGKLLRWNIAKNDPPVLWEIKTDEATDPGFYRQVVETSADLWSSVEGSYLRLGEAKSGEVARITINLNANIDGQEFSSGFSVFDEADKIGPTHCSITVLASPEEYGISKTILHELGHCLGLGHSLVPEAIMSYSLEENRFALDTDDRAVVARLYPADGSKPSVPLGCSIGISLESDCLLFAIGLMCLPFGVAVLNSRKKKL
jgi:hypothetical protein